MKHLKLKLIALSLSIGLSLNVRATEINLALNCCQLVGQCNKVVDAKNEQIKACEALAQNQEKASTILNEKLAAEYKADKAWYKNPYLYFTVGLLSGFFVATKR